MIFRWSVKKFNAQQSCCDGLYNVQYYRKKYMQMLISTVLSNELFFSPRGEDTKTAQPTWITGKGNGRQVRNVFYICYRVECFPVNLWNFFFVLLSTRLVCNHCNACPFKLKENWWVVLSLYLVSQWWITRLSLQYEQIHVNMSVESKRTYSYQVKLPMSCLEPLLISCF